MHWQTPLYDTKRLASTPKMPACMLRNMIPRLLCLALPVFHILAFSLVTHQSHMPISAHISLRSLHKLYMIPLSKLITSPLLPRGFCRPLSTPLADGSKASSLRHLEGIGFEYSRYCHFSTGAILGQIIGSTLPSTTTRLPQLLIVVIYSQQIRIKNTDSH